MDDGMLRRKVTLVTGAANGIGRAAALLFARYGAHVVVSDVDRDGGEAVRAEIEAMGREAIFVRADIARSADVAALVGAAVARWGRLDGAFNNAGINGKIGALVDGDEAEWERTVGVNLKGTWLCMKHELAQMVKQGGGAIVNNSSVAGLVAFPGLAIYTATKHGIVGLTKAAALEHATQGIRVNVLCTGLVRTQLSMSAVREGFMTEEQLVALEPVGRLASPEEVAEAAAWLLSERASFVTGHTMTVDGGFVAR
jgi:NAD(P)-dependent dehydrogenase (short-subunit alcohol dehydrogenase family)